MRTLLLTLGATFLFATSAGAQMACPPAAGIPPFIANCGNAAFQSCSVDVAGVPRHFCIHQPSGPTPPAGWPVIVGFHGSGGMGSRAVEWMDHATDQRAILVAPTALPSSEQTGGCTRRWRHLGGAIPTWADFALPDPNGCGPSAAENGHDLEFVEELLDEIEAVQEVSDFYAFGFSNGGGMTFQLYLTEPLASRFAAYGVIGTGLGATKIDQHMAGGSYLGFSDNQETRRPVMVIIGTNEKSYMSWARMIQRVDQLASFGVNGPCPSVATPQEVISCYARNAAAPGLPDNTLPTERSETRNWLVGFNNAVPRAVEGLYPDLGHGAVDPRRHDRTMVARQHYPPRGGPDSEPVTLLTVIDGEHNVPGLSGNHAPCIGNCDIVAFDELLQFWRAYAGLQDWR